ncbi:ribosomal RNA processing protein 1 homolog A [Manis pentadactyla]|uniref:ribosomal RNA processing protein 1 homolog A n=1 Tax=Manis pentadactyla TaxID=143292 RepID=UPI00255CB884|nr:ribosomal RNA processing protein 1 homolog A [Manis pentadactyla]
MTAPGRTSTGLTFPTRPLRGAGLRLGSLYVTSGRAPRRGPAGAAKCRHAARRGKAAWSSLRGVSVAGVMAPRVQLSLEIQLAQRLAGNEQVTRDRAVRRLRKYIVARTQQAAGGFTHDELLKVWKGLFYCMWMQDKPLLQEDLGRTISQLIHAFQTTEAQLLFLQTFWQTMNREWIGIDRLRLDKFYMLMRMVLNESLRALKMRGWEDRQVEQLLELLTTEILHPDSQAPNGVKSHFLEIFLEELSKVGADELTADQNLRFIDPFCRIAAQTKDPLVLHNITRGVLETIVEQAPFAIEDLMNELDAQEEDTLEGDEQEQGVPSRKPPEGSPRGPDPGEGEEQAGDGDDDGGSGPVLQFDYEAVANRLFEVASHQNTPSQNRKRLYKVIRKLQDLAEGLFPEDDILEKAYRKLQEGRRERKRKKRLPKFQLQNKTGEGERAGRGLDLSSGSERMKTRRRRGAAADPTAPQEQPGGRGRRDTFKQRRRPWAGPKVKGTDCQKPDRKKKRQLEGRE